MLLGVAEQGTGTYWAVMRPDGTLYGEGRGVAMVPPARSRPDRRASARSRRWRGELSRLDLLPVGFAQVDAPQ
jgi:hypothetical protein